MAFETWLAFVAASAVLLAIPGPTILLVLSYALGRGWGTAAPVAVGVALGDFTAMSLSLLGVGALLAGSAALFTALKWVGAAYLVWLGVRLWRAGADLEVEARRDRRPAPGMIAHAWLVTTLNPKSILFFVAFAPQFVDPARAFWPQALILEATFVTLAFLNALGYAWLGSRAGGLATSPRAVRLFNRAGGTALIGAGAAAALGARLMLKVRVIPCLDVKDGRVVKGINFVDLRDAGDPVEAAQAYDAAGADELCFLDIAATHENRGTMYDLATRTAEHCFMPLTVGGGVRTPEDVRALLLAGADKVSFNSAAVADPIVVARAADRFGSQCIVVAVDAKQVAPGRWEIFTHGGRRPTGIDAVEFAAEVERQGAGEILLTSMDRDGTRSGFDLALTRTIVDAVGVPVIASGGVGTLDHLVEGVTQGGASAVLAASIFHFGEFTIAEAKAAMAAAGIPVRPA